MFKDAASLTLPPPFILKKKKNSSSAFSLNGVSELDRRRGGLFGPGACNYGGEQSPLIFIDQVPRRVFEPLPPAINAVW